MKRLKLSRSVWLTILYVALSALVLWSYSTWAAGLSEADAARDTLQQCRQLADQIRGLSRKPLRAAAEAHSASEVAQAIEKAAKAAQLPAANLVQIDPQTARRLGNSAYSEQPTHVELRDVTLRQLIKFLHTIVEDQLGVDVAEIRLRAPREERSAGPAEETWAAEVTLTNLIYAP